MNHMRNTCRVLLLLSDTGQKLSTKEMSTHLDLTEQQVNSACMQLRVKQKVCMVEIDGVNHHYFNDDFEPSKRPKLVKATSPVAYASERIRTINERKSIPASAVSFYRYSDKKIALLRKLERLCSSDEKDLLIGIIHDYENVMARAS